jgi:hypothetical protein
VPKVNRFVSRILAEHRAQAGNETPDFVDVLLSLQGHDKLSDSDMIAVLWVSKQTHEYMYITRESYYTIFCPNM